MSSQDPSPKNPLDECPNERAADCWGGFTKGFKISVAITVAILVIMAVTLV